MLPSENSHTDQLRSHVQFSPDASPGKSLQAQSVLESSDLGYSTTQHQRDPKTFRRIRPSDNQPQETHPLWLETSLSDTISSLDSQSLRNLAREHGRILDITAPEDSLRDSDISSQSLQRRLTGVFIPKSRACSLQKSSPAMSSPKRRASSIILPLQGHHEASFHGLDETNTPHALRRSTSTPLAGGLRTSAQRTEADDRTKGILDRPWPVPVHDPEHSLILPAALSPKIRHLSSIRPFSERALSLSRKDVCSSLGEAEISRIRQLARKNAVDLEQQRITIATEHSKEKHLPEVGQRNTINIVRDHPYLSSFKTRKDLPRPPSRSSYDADAEASSNSERLGRQHIILPSRAYNPNSPAQDQSPRKLGSPPLRPRPPTLFDTMPRVSDIERTPSNRTPIERFLREKDEIKGQDSTLPDIQECENSRDPHADPETAPQPTLQTSSPNRVATFAKFQSTTPSPPKKSSRWKFSAALKAHKASLKLVPDFTYSTDTDSEVTQILEKRPTGTTLVGSPTESVKDIEVGQWAREYAEARRELEARRTKSFESRHNGEARVDTGWVAWSQGLVGLLIIFNVV